MGRIVNLMERRATREREQEEIRFAKWFQENIIANASTDELVAIKEALDNADAAEYKRITEPILMRKIIREFNT